MPSFCRRLPVLFALLLASCATPLPDPTKKPVLYNPEAISSETGIASWYRDHRTASGERFSGTALAGAHKKLPFGTKVRVIDLKTNKSIIIRINDRGPYIRGRIIDLTVGAARQLGMYDRGIAKVRVEVLKEIPILTKPNLHEKPAAKPRTKPPAVAPVKPSAKPKAQRPVKPQPAPKPTVKPPAKPTPKPEEKPIVQAVEKPPVKPAPPAKPATGRSR